MRCLLDTQSFLWFIAGSGKLSDQARNLIADMDNEVLLSVASLWEIVIKVSLGKLVLSQPFEELIPKQLDQNEIKVLQIELDHLSALVKLPLHHRDPFDRLIIAQALVEDVPVITQDAAFQNYPAQVIS